MTILYTLVARGSVLLVEFNGTSTNASTIARQILEKIPGNNDMNVSYSQDRYICHAKRTDALTILCMADDDAGKIRVSMSWRSAGGRNEGGGDDKGKESGSSPGSLVDGVVHRQPGALVILPPPRKVARPELQRNSLPVGTIDEEEWVTIYGFSPANTNLVLREFEKCGVILKHVLGPRDSNWMHILYQSRFDAQKALSKNRMQLNGALIIGVKPVDPMQRQALTDRLNNHGGFMPLPPLTTAVS